MNADGGDEDRRLKQFIKMTQDEDDFLTVNTKDSSNCPFALKLIACQLLHEIATFLRETHQYLPTKSSRRSSVAAKEVTSVLKVEPAPKPPINTNRRWSMALSKTLILISL